MIEKGVHFDYEMKFPGSSCVLDAILKKGQSIHLESGVMVYHDANMTIETIKSSSGLFKSMKRLFAGEKFWINKFTAQEDGIVGMAPNYPGDIMHIKVKQGDEWVVFKNGFMACSSGLEMDTKFKGMGKALIGTGKAFQLVVRAEEDEEDLIISSLGGFMVRDLAEGETMRVDNDHFVAREKTVDWGHRTIGGLKSTLFSGEGLVIEARGPGKVIFQTRSNIGFARWMAKQIKPYLPKSGKSSSFSKFTRR